MGLYNTCSRPSLICTVAACCACVLRYIVCFFGAHILLIAIMLMVQWLVLQNFKTCYLPPRIMMIRAQIVPRRALRFCTTNGDLKRCFGVQEAMIT